MSETSHCTHEVSLRGASSFATAMEDKTEDGGGQEHERRGGAMMRGGELQLSEDVGDVGLV